jgi:hypothetical protein
MASRAWLKSGSLAAALMLGTIAGCDGKESAPPSPPAQSAAPQGAPIDGSAPASAAAPAPAAAPAAQGMPQDGSGDKPPASPAASTSSAPSVADAVNANRKAVTAEELKAATPSADAPPGSAEHMSYQQLLAQRNAKMAAPRAVEGYESVAYAMLTDYGYMPKAPTRAATPEERKLETSVPLDADDQIPSPVKALHGKKVAVQGFMIPVDFQDGGTNEFLLVQVVPDCYFCQQPQPNEWIEVKTADGIRLPYSGDESFIVTGTIEIGAKYKGGYFLSLYRMVADGIQKP